MKKFTSYILLIIYVNGLLAPISPVINDTLAHIFWRAQHLATVHCVNGQYHVHYELYKAGNSESKKNNQTKADETFSIHIQPENKPIDFTFSPDSFILLVQEPGDNPSMRVTIPPPKTA